jgi:hypothetical protein
MRCRVFQGPSSKLAPKPHPQEEDRSHASGERKSILAMGGVVQDACILSVSYSMRRCCCGPRRLDEHQLKNMSSLTLDRYRLSLKPFLDFLDKNNFSPTVPDEWDDLLVEYKNSGAKCSKSQFEQVVFALEFCFPRLKFSLSWSHAVLQGWSSSHIPKHAVPLCRGPASVLAAKLSHLGESRMGAGLISQQTLGLRPSELLRLFSEDIMIPDVSGSPFVLRLGTQAPRQRENSLCWFAMTLTP